MIRIKTLSVPLISALLILMSPTAFALDGAELYKTKTCLTCHGKDGKTTIMPSYPKVAGQNEAYALQQMKDIKSGARANGMSAAMKGVMHLVSDEEIEALAKYLSTLEP
ncbi:MAG: c-type cytochrome [Gammaproteobacteria bacterium]|nr:c-type cytochrome [Gammaproteobacteria bacterium]